MGVDLWVLPEISHNGEPWRPLRHSSELFKAPREQALFALLGDVTNGKGRFSKSWQPPRVHEGHQIPGFWYAPDDGDHDPIEPISEPKGLAEGSSNVWLGHVAWWQSQREKIVVTHYSLDELIAGDWDQVVYRHGILFEQDYLELTEKNKVPRRWMGQAVGEKTVVVNEIEYAAGKRGETETLVKARWKAGTVRQVSDGFIDGLIALEEMRPETSRMRLQMLFEA